MKAKCCYLGDSSGPCPNDAEWQVFFDESPDGSTLACTQHLGIMCDPDYSNMVVALSEEEKERWAEQLPVVATDHNAVLAVRAAMRWDGPTYEDLVARGQDPSTGDLPGEIHPA